MKIEDKTLDFKFLNIMMYCAFAFLICFFLKSIGILEKLLQALLALAPIYLGFIICWISTPLANLLKKIGLNKSVSAFIINNNSWCYCIIIIYCCSNVYYSNNRTGKGFSSNI